MRIRVNGPLCACQWTPPPSKEETWPPFANAPPLSKEETWPGWGGGVPKLHHQAASWCLVPVTMSLVMHLYELLAWFALMFCIFSYSFVVSTKDLGLDSDYELWLATK